jgi:gamma-glutamyltranspeptidase/glutathione hydrolase
MDIQVLMSAPIDRSHLFRNDLHHEVRHAKYTIWHVSAGLRTHLSVTLHMRIHVLLPLLLWVPGAGLSQVKCDTASGGMVASAHPLATEAGLSMLRRGGNAFDAAAAVSFMLSVVEPSMSGIGGRLQALWYRPGKGPAGIDATTQAPAGYLRRPKEEEDGHGTIGVPGMVKGIVRMQTSYGQLPFRAVMRPAIRAAAHGHRMHPDESLRQASAIRQTRRFPGTVRHFLRNDTVPAGGVAFRQRRLASTMRRIARDKGRSFYSGRMAASIADEVAAGGGFLTKADMEGYRAPDARMLYGSYRGYTVAAMGMPCYGATVIEMLHMLERSDLGALDEAAFLLRHAAVHHRAYEDRPLLRTKEDSLVLPYWADKRLHDTLPAALRSLDAGPAADNGNGHTTHLTVADREGNTVSLTQSLGPVMGSKVASMSHGFLFATTMGPYLGTVKAGERAASHISPVILLKDGKPVLVLGAAGGARIVPAIVQVISRVVDQGMPLPQALAAARVYQLPDRLLVEDHPGVLWKDGVTPVRLASLGLRTERVRLPAQFGRVHAVQRLSDGSWTGAADPDWGGSARGLD